LYDRKTLMKVLMSFYEDWEEEDVDIREKEKECVYV
jgi:hypothetical protein